MNFATWSLLFENPIYGIGPESYAANFNVQLTGLLIDGDANTGTILGSVKGDFSSIDLQAWKFTPLANEQALEFAQRISPNAVINENNELIFQEIES